MGKWIKNIIALLILAFLFWYLYKHWDRVKVVFEMRPLDVILLYVLTAFGTMNNSRIFQKLIAEFDVKVHYVEIVLLQNATRLLNYIPMKFGTVFRINYLKRQYNLKYVDGVTVLAHQALLTVLMAGVVGLAGLLAGRRLNSYDGAVLSGIFACFVIAALVFIFIPLPVPDGDRKLSRIFRNFVSARESISKNIPTTFLCLAHLILTFAFTSIRLWVIYRGLGHNVSAASCVILGAVGFGSMVLGLTPGAVGVRELLLCSAATVLDVPLETGLLAAVFDRAIMLTWTFSVGMACTVWFWRKYPADFKLNRKSEPIEDQ